MTIGEFIEQLSWFDPDDQIYCATEVILGPQTGTVKKITAGELEIAVHTYTASDGDHLDAVIYPVDHTNPIVEVYPPPIFPESDTT